ncbi:glycerophosphodiester phosphodiesterase [Lapidilactobacillus luobeiensis]|uniref:glycerophosphodiester phosphodiesterase n=1 Tax=Lapidilactobacillus luobeiensis TaxID=2950371 RepID=UPI0021C2EC69|nr:glycerophosphodiester phosphodiesterase [Lapidilactobacillus luobeiensis]
MSKARKQRQLFPSIRFWSQCNRLFWRYWPQILIFSVLLNFLVGILVTAMRRLTSWLLVKFDVAYLSYTNITTVAFQKPWLVFILLLLLAVILALVYWQFTIFILFVNDLSQDQRPHFRQLLRRAGRKFKLLNFKTFLFLTLFFILMLPVLSSFFSTPLLGKVVIPDFIMAFIDVHLWYPWIIAGLYLISLWLGLRYLYVLPLMVLYDESVTSARHHSWELTRKNNWRNFRKGAVGLIFAGALFGILNSLLFWLQTAFDLTDFAFIGANLTMLLTALVTLLFGSYTTMVLLLLMQSPLPRPLPPTYQPHHPHFWRYLTGLVCGLYLLTFGLFNYGYLKNLTSTQPLLISHRGVDAGNGVQNTIPALTKTAAKKPDYIEMDVQETKDGQYVCFHDPTLRVLAGRRERPQDLTLAQLQKITVKENGHQAKIPSFDDYLAQATRLDQKLLIEYKVSRQDSPTAVKNFIKRYQNRIRENQGQVQSLDYQAIATVKTESSQTFSAYIMPYNFAFPNTEMNAYAMEVTTLNSDFVDQAHEHQQLVYSWDVNDSSTLNRMMFFNVDGIITDRLTTMRQHLHDNQKQPQYASLMSNYRDIVNLVWND